MTADSEQAARDTQGAISAAEQDTLLGVFAVRLPPAPGEHDADASFERLAGRAGAVAPPATVRFTVHGGRGPRIRTLVADKSGCAVVAGETPACDSEVITDAETWRLIASGEVSALEAFARGRVRLRGDVLAARRLFAGLIGDMRQASTEKASKEKAVGT